MTGGLINALCTCHRTFSSRAREQLVYLRAAIHRTLLNKAALRLSLIFLLVNIMRNWWRKKSRVRVQLRLDELVSNFSDLIPPTNSADNLKALFPSVEKCSERIISDNSTSKDSDSNSKDSPTRKLA